MNEIREEFYDIIREGGYCYPDSLVDRFIQPDDNYRRIEEIIRRIKLLNEHFSFNFLQFLEEQSRILIEARGILESIKILRDGLSYDGIYADVLINYN